MSFCDIVVDACPRSDVYRTLEHAREIAGEFGADLSVVSYAWPPFSIREALVLNAFSVQEQTQAMEDALTAARNAFDNVFGADRKGVGWCSGIGDPNKAMRDHLLTADLLITSSSDADACVLPNPAELAIRSGAPVLRLGRQSLKGFGHVLVAWKASPQARRAVHDALPLLQRAERVTTVGVGDGVFADRLEAVAEHLRRHKVKACHRHISRSEEAVCADLLTLAEREGANLIVAGISYHSLLTERMLGSVTREILKSRDMTWFLAQ